MNVEQGCAAAALRRVVCYPHPPFPRQRPPAVEGVPKPYRRRFSSRFLAPTDAADAGREGWIYGPEHIRP